MKGGCNKWYNTEVKIAKRNMKHTEKNMGMIKQINGNTMSSSNYVS